MDVVQKYELSLRATRIFEKESLIFCYFAIFTFLSSSSLLNLQLLLFLVGTILFLISAFSFVYDKWRQRTAGAVVILLLINKQLVAVQNHLLKARTGARASPGELG